MAPCRATSTPTPFGPPNLCADRESSWTWGVMLRRSTQHGACTASVWSTAWGAYSATTAATAARSLTTPTSLLTAITLTTVTSGVSLSARDESVEVYRAVGHHRNLHPVEPLDAGEHGVVLGSRADRRTTAPGDGTQDGRVVALRASTGEDHLTWGTADDPGHHVARFVYCGARLAGEAVRPGRVGEALGIGTAASPPPPRGTSASWPHDRGR